MISLAGAKKTAAPATMAALAAAALLACLAWLAYLATAATPAHAESRYSLRGQGEPTSSAVASIRAQGGAEIAGTTPSLGGNPASLVFADLTRFTGSWDTEWLRTEEPTDGSLRVRKEYEGLPNLGIVFPLRGDMRLGLGLLTTRRIGGRIERDAFTDEGVEYRQAFDANGNQVRIPVLLASAWKGVQFGAGLDVLLSTRETLWVNEFTAESGFTSSRDLDRTSLWGPAFRAGVRVPIGSRMAIGAWTFRPGTLDGDRRFENENPFDESSDFEIDATGETASAFGVGLEGSPTARLTLRGDWVREAWEDVDPAGLPDQYVDVDRVSIGAEWAPPKRMRGPQYPFRVGYRTEVLHTLDARGEKNREHLFSAGSGVGFAGGRGTLDWYAEYGWRGERKTSEYYEQFVRFGMTLTGVEKWARRRTPEEEDDGDW